MNENRIIFTKGRIIFIIAAVLLCAFLALFLHINTKYKVIHVDVVGNEHYTDEEIKNMILTEGMSGNSLFLSLKYRNKEISDIPFIESMSVEVTAPDSIQIMVYEKALAGCVEYLGKYVYFDREGIIVEISSEKTDSVPQVIGLKFDRFALNEVLPIEDTAMFGEILDITQMLEKYGINATKIYFDKSKNITLYFDEARVSLGEKTNLDEKMMLLQGVLPTLEGKKGILRLENYDENSKNVTFEID